MKWVVFIFIFILCIQICFAVKFNELMYDSMGSDDDKEWFEIFNEKNYSVDMQNWKFFEDGTNHNIVAVQGDYILNSNEYAVVAEDPLTFLSNYSYNGTLFDSTFSLSNTGETIVLKNKTGQVQDNFTYSFIIGGNENGFSIGKYGLSWKESFPTPGNSNFISNICDWKVSIVHDKLIFEDKTDFAWKVKTERILGGSSIVTIKRGIYDMYSNSVKSYADLVHNITNRETLSYEPNLNPGTYLLKAEISPSCNDSVSENNFDQALIAVKGSAVNNKKSSVEILQIYDLGKDKEAEFGQLIRVKLNAYRGDTTKTTVSMWVERSDEKISKVLSLKLDEKYSEQELTLPIQLFSNCKSEFNEGEYTIILEGFGETDEYDLDVYGNYDECINITKAVAKEVKEELKNIESNSGTTTSSIFESKSNVFNSGKPYVVSTVMFESSQRKAEKLVPYFIGTIMTLTTLFLIFVKPL